jgi:NAD(P)-dependent dehydrogenase (short-subunit alcohol dehydrogenase family)
MRLKNQVAVVTGGGSGLGEGICRCLAREGTHVVVSDLDPDLAQGVAEKVEALGQNFLAIQTDVRKPDQCEKLIAKSFEGLKRLMTTKDAIKILVKT